MLLSLRSGLLHAGVEIDELELDDLCFGLCTDVSLLSFVLCSAAAAAQLLPLPPDDSEFVVCPLPLLVSGDTVRDGLVVNMSKWSARFDMPYTADNLANAWYHGVYVCGGMGVVPVTL